MDGALVPGSQSRPRRADHPGAPGRTAAIPDAAPGAGGRTFLVLSLAPRGPLLVASWASAQLSIRPNSAVDTVFRQAHHSRLFHRWACYVVDFGGPFVSSWSPCRRRQAPGPAFTSV